LVGLLRLSLGIAAVLLSEVLPAGTFFSACPAAGVWSLGSAAAPLSCLDASPAGELCVAPALESVGLLSVCACAPNAARTAASAETSILVIPASLVDVQGDGGDGGLRIQPTGARRYAEKLDPQPHVCLAFGFLKAKPLWPNCPST